MRTCKQFLGHARLLQLLQIEQCADQRLHLIPRLRSLPTGIVLKAFVACERLGLGWWFTPAVNNAFGQLRLIAHNQVVFQPATMALLIS